MAEGKEAFLSDQADKILTEALKLTTSDRARVAAELIASVDGEPDTEAEAELLASADRRLRPRATATRLLVAASAIIVGREPLRRVHRLRIAASAPDPLQR